MSVADLVAELVDEPVAVLAAGLVAVSAADLVAELVGEQVVVSAVVTVVD